MGPFLRECEGIMNKLLLITFLFLTGCTLMPTYHRPNSPVSEKWSQSSLSKNQTPVADIGWREFFSDPRLAKLIEIALNNNRDLRIAALNTDQIRAQYRLFNRALLPEFEAHGGGLFQRDVTSAGKHPMTTKYTAHVNTAYEIDLFGHIRSLKAQALEQYFSTSEAQRSVQMALVSEVAIQYLNQRALAEQLDLSKQTLKSVQSYYQLVKSSYELGNSSALDLHSTEAQVQSAMANIAAYERQYNQAQDALEFLIGQPLPADLPVPQSLTTEKLLADLSPGLPSDLLARRPDILQAEHQLKAANANIGVVRSAFFPKITLTAAEGVSSVQLARLFTPGANAWSFAPDITLPLFNRTNNIANLEAANIGKSIEIARYEKAIQNAFREVSDILIARRTFNDQITAQKALVAAQEQRYQLAGERYKNGVDNYLSVLTAQQDLYVAQQNLIQAEFLRLSNLISFYKALGGGWQEHTL
jgi:multidrug efflux system outer membrane protein